MSKCQQLWSVWFIVYLLVINSYLTFVSIRNYLEFKYQMFDIAYGGNWDMRSIYLILGCLNLSLGLLPLIIYTSIVPQGNFANDGYILGRDPDVFDLVTNKQGKGKIVPIMSRKTSFCRNSSIRLIYMEFPPFCYFLNVISAFCYFLPRSFIEAQRIHYGVLKSSYIWHSDLDFLFDPDQQHSDFIYSGKSIYIQPVSVAYFNLGLSLVFLSLQYSRTLWHVSRQFTILLSSIMILCTIHILIEISSTTVMMKVSYNPLNVEEQLRITISAFTVQILSFMGNLILLLSFSSVFHYAVLQYADSRIHNNRKSFGQMPNSSIPIKINTSNHIDMPSPFSHSLSENNYSDSIIEPFFSKSNVTHIFAIIFLCLTVMLKSTNLYMSYVHLYQTTSDSLTLINIVISCLYFIVWIFLWFAFALRRNWNFKIKTNIKFINEPFFFNGKANSIENGTNQQIRDTKSSQNSLSKQDIMTLNNNVFDGCSDDTDMSSKLSSNNYVLLQSMRNGQTCPVGYIGQAPNSRNPLHLPYSLDHQRLSSGNTIYFNDDSINNRSLLLDDCLGSEHSFNSNRSHNICFENMPPVLPNFDENRYKTINPNFVVMDKLIPKYLRHQSLDYNSLTHFSSPQNEFNIPTVTSPSSSFLNDNCIQNFNVDIPQPKHFICNYEKKPTLNSAKFSILEPNDFVIKNCESDMQRRSNCNGETYRMVAMSPLLFPTLEESTNDNVPLESEFLLQKHNHKLRDPNYEIISESIKRHVESNINKSDTLVDRMCSQV